MPKTPPTTTERALRHLERRIREARAAAATPAEAKLARQTENLARNLRANMADLGLE